MTLIVVAPAMRPWRRHTARQHAARAAALTATIGKQPLDAVHAVKEYLKEAPSMPAAARGGFGASLFAGVLSSR